MKYIPTLICITLGTCLALTAQAEDADQGDKKAAKKEQTNSGGDAAIKLESVFVGDKEQPAVSYFIPWQGIGAPDKLYWNVEEKHDKALNLVDREVMLRSIHFYEEMDLEAVKAP